MTDRLLQEGSLAVLATLKNDFLLYVGLSIF